MKFQRPRGTQDITPADTPLWRKLRMIFESVATAYGYGGIEFPIFERAELFTRAVGETSDVVSKEMYTFQDRKGRNLSLRPEGTAGVVRAVLENGLLDAGGILRLAYWGPMFRYDRPQAGRYRQFHQLGIEAFGSASPALDAESIELLVGILGRLGLGELKVKVGSVGDDCCRPQYVDSLREALRGIESSLCPVCQERIDSNPLRVFDCKVSACRQALEPMPSMVDHLCDDCASHRVRVEALLDERGIAWERDAAMVRGLDYYTRTVFEVHYPPLGAQSALGGGGRYDHLVEDCGGPATAAVGFSSGLERLILAMRSEGGDDPDELLRRGAYCVPMTPGAEAAAGRVAAMLRSQLPVEVDYTARSLKACLKTANARRARFAIIVGEDELRDGTVTLKDLDAGEQKTLAEEQLLDVIVAWRTGETARDDS